ncbi:MAG: hypothetical protein DBY04_03495 [Clostridiales bacterium]|nr:MAG: hypothetical protein DBY04_03495 [Clostridiales bacterium]
MEEKQILLISNICFEPHFRSYIKYCFSNHSCDVKINTVSFEDISTDVTKFKTADIIVVCLNYETLYNDLSNDLFVGKISKTTIECDCVQKSSELYSYIKSHSYARIIWFGFEDYYLFQNNNYGMLLAFDGLIDRINLTISDLIQEDTFIDLKRLIATVGIKNAYDIKGKYRWNVPYSKELIHFMVDEIQKQDLIYNGNTRKCLVLDCDNVLWGGILSEDQISGIKIGASGLGRPFQDFQKYLLELYYHGVILAVCSKNDEADVMCVFKEHTGMVLREENIVCFKCNWENKSDNIIDISKTLNIGLDSIVFVDDSIFEIESVKSILPEVRSILYQRDTIYNELSCFNLRRNLDLKTVQERTSTYKSNILRTKLQNSTISYEEYIESLEMFLDIHKVKECELARISELTQRTNKCTNGTRYTVDQLKNKASLENYELFAVCLSDRFSNLGVVGTIGLESAHVDLFSLSCRALGRGIEEKMLQWILERGIDKIKFIETSKNTSLLSIINQKDLRLLEIKT